jgi:hypothetical protein
MGTVLIALEAHGMNDDRESVAWHAVNALIEDAKRNVKGARGEAFACATYNAVRRTKAFASCCKNIASVSTSQLSRHGATRLCSILPRPANACRLSALTVAPEPPGLLIGIQSIGVLDIAHRLQIILGLQYPLYLCPKLAMPGDVAHQRPARHHLARFGNGR